MDNPAHHPPSREEVLALARRVASGERLSPMMASVSIGMVCRALVEEHSARLEAQAQADELAAWIRLVDQLPF
jgi:hypothetical protein